MLFQTSGFAKIDGTVTFFLYYLKYNFFKWCGYTTNFKIQKSFKKKLSSLS